MVLIRGMEDTRCGGQEAGIALTFSKFIILLLARDVCHCVNLKVVERPIGRKKMKKIEETINDPLYD